MTTTTQRVLYFLLAVCVSSAIRPTHRNPSCRRLPLRSTPDAADPFFSPPAALQSQMDRTLDALDGEEWDHVVIGSGIGGLACAALLAYYGERVLVLESHYLPGGVAHTFERDGFKFDAGPSLWNGMNKKPFNPLREVMEIIGEGSTVKYAQYDGWMMHVPEGSFKFTVGEGKFEPILEKFGGPNALAEWAELNRVLKPIQKLAGAIPPLALRSDAWGALTLMPHFGSLLGGLPVVNKVEGSFKAVSGTVVKDAFLENWFEFLAFALSGMPADDTIAAAVAYTMRDLHQRGAVLDYPIGGAAAVIDALVRGVTKKGGKVLLSTHVESIVLDDEGGTTRATGVRLRRGGRIIRAKKGVISNASVWDTAKLLAAATGAATGAASASSSTTQPSKADANVPAHTHAIPDDLLREINAAMQTPQTGSFVHLHVGINATGLPPLESHYTVINKWSPIDAEQNHVIISIPSTLDPALAPDGCHVIHAYAAANEPFAPYDGKMSRKEYEKYKSDRCEFLWKAIERSIPDVRSRAVVTLLGSPKTHARFNRRYMGTFGPAWAAGKDKFPFPRDVFKSVKGLTMCGDSVFPGIGVPAVAASGANAASSSVDVWKHLKMLERLEEIKRE